VKTLSGFVRLSHAPAVSLVAYKTSADVVSKLVTLIVTVAAARTLPAGDFGVIALAMTSGWLLGVASDAGLPMYLATRVAQATAAQQPTQPIVAAVMQWRLWLAIAAAAAGTALGIALVPTVTLLAFVLIIAHQLFGAVLDTLAHTYRGLGRTDIESTISLGHRGAIALGALTVLAVRPSLLMFAVALAAPPAVALVVSYFVVRRVTRAHVDDRGHAASLTTRRFFDEVAPLGVGILLSALYFRCDVYFLERLHGVELVGTYNAAFRVVDALRLFPAAALAVAYPTLCAASTLRPLRRISAALVAAAVVVATTLYLGARPLLVLVYGEPFGAGGAALQVLALCVPLFYLNYGLMYQLIAWEQQHTFLRITAAALAVNLAGNAWLIPAGGMVGAAVSTLLTEVVVCAGCMTALARR
jgi:O-antigen/teichoic acid export membrane protein